MKIRARIAGFSRSAGLIGLGLVVCLAASCSLPGKLTGERYALMIGISEYISPTIQDLGYPKDDAQDLGALLDQSGWNVDSSTLIDTGAIKAKIKTTMETYFKAIPSQATALIYYSGHGSEDGSEAYIVPSDYGGTKTSLISTTELSLWIQDYILPYTSNVIVIIDACYSGGFVPQSDSLDIIDPDYDANFGSSVSSLALTGLGDLGVLLAKNLEQSGKLEPIVMSASGSEELSWESSSLKHGVFTYYLMKAAESGDTNRDDYVSATEAYTYAAKGIDKNWNELYGNSAAFYPHITGGLRDLVLFDLH